MSIKFYPDLVQGSEEWRAVRCGMLTASEMKLILTPTLKPTSNEKERAHLFELAAQRVNKYVEPSYISDAMLRGIGDEVLARDAYAKNFAPVYDMGFITNDALGFPIGFSPDGLVGDDGFIECKSRSQKFQFETIVNYAPQNIIMPEFILQVMTGLFVSKRIWCDHISYCGGMPMTVTRIHRDDKIIDAICDAAIAFEERLEKKIDQYHIALSSGIRTVATERVIDQEIEI